MKSIFLLVMAICLAPITSSAETVLKEKYGLTQKDEKAFQYGYDVGWYLRGIYSVCYGYDSERIPKRGALILIETPFNEAKKLIKKRIFKFTMEGYLISYPKCIEIMPPFK